MYILFAFIFVLSGHCEQLHHCDGFISFQLCGYPDRMHEEQSLVKILPREAGVTEAAPSTRSLSPKTSPEDTEVPSPATGNTVFNLVFLPW